VDLAAEWLGSLRGEADTYARLALENIGREFPSYVATLMTVVTHWLAAYAVLLFS